MTKYGPHEVVMVNLPGSPVHEREAIILSIKERDGKPAYTVEVEGEECSWTLPESCLLWTGRSVVRHRGWDGSPYDPGDKVQLRPVEDFQPKREHDGRIGQVVAKFQEDETWWYTIQVEDGRYLVFREDELRPLP